MVRGGLPLSTWQSRFLYRNHLIIMLEGFREDICWAFPDILFPLKGLEAWGQKQSRQGKSCACSRSGLSQCCLSRGESAGQELTLGGASEISLRPPLGASSCLWKQWPCRKQDRAIHLFLFIKGKQLTIALPNLLPGQLTAVWVWSRPGWMVGQEEVTLSRKCYRRKQTNK